MPRGKKVKAINVVRLTETERKKFTKKYQCKRCHSFFVDTKEELEYHNESMHGEYSAAKHHANRKGSRKLKQIYLNRNIKTKPEVIPIEKRKGKKKKPRNCFAFRCQNCKHVGIIYGDIKKKLQNLLLCQTCHANALIDSRQEIIDFMKKKEMGPVQFMDFCGINVTLFEGYKEIKYKGKGRALDGFINRRNGKK
ncbi:MAG: hypothetical protein IMZ52_01105 [Actinobacteria bacterium]|nr:hypothetical protein [Actinomycetota bacterium]MBE3114736.1 hypothetical protein [Actinomycetota bacterium]